MMTMLAAYKITSRFPVAFPIFSSRLYHVSVPLVTQTKLFNREKEVEFILNVLKNKTPQLSLITGPINSGKSVLMRHILEKLSKESVPPTMLTINMRELPFTDVDTFIRSFKVKILRWYKKLLDVFSFQSELFSIEWKKSPPSLIDLLEAMSKELPDWSWLRGSRIPLPVLFIDEANKLRELVAMDPNGQKALETIFTWFVAMTKEQRKFHVILCSSDSFMYNWLANFVGNDRFNVYAIGHLSKEQAKIFFNERIVTVASGENKISFEEMYGVCGGNMFLMEIMYFDYIFGGIHPKESFYLQLARSRLLKVLSPTNSFINDPLKSPPKWTKEEVLIIINRLANSEGGYVNYYEMCEEIKEESLQSLIEYNIVHMRPYCKLSYQDLDPLPIKPEPVITPESQVGLLAMKQLVQKDRYNIMKDKK